MSLDTQNLVLEQEASAQSGTCGSVAPTDMLDQAQAASAFFKRRWRMKGG